MAKSGIIKSVSGIVTAHLPQGESRQLQAGDIVYDNDIIKTDPGASASIELVNGQIVNLSQNTQAVLDESVTGPVHVSDALLDRVQALQDALEKNEQILEEEETAVGEEDDGYDFSFEYTPGDQSHGEVGDYLFGTGYGGETQIDIKDPGDRDDDGGPPLTSLPTEPDKDSPPSNVEPSPLTETEDATPTIGPEAGQVEETRLVDTAEGDFDIVSNDGVAAVRVNGVDVTTGGTVAGQYGTLVVDENGHWTYTLTDNALDHSAQGNDTVLDSFALEVEDLDGDTEGDTLAITVVDDVPIAIADIDIVKEGDEATGNVFTGEGVLKDYYGNLIQGDADIEGADGAAVVGVRAEGGDQTTPAEGNLGIEIAGEYGTLTLNADGSYTYVTGPDAVNVDSVDVFVYTIEDGDGDLSTTTLTINVADASEFIVGSEGDDVAGSQDNWTVEPDGSAQIIGGEGNDTIDGAGGTDVINAGTGDDTIVFDENDGLVDAGQGYATLQVGQNGTLDFSNVKNIEQIDLNNDGSGQEITLSLDEVLNMTGADHILHITGEAGDSITLTGVNSGDWTNNADGSFTKADNSNIQVIIAGPAIDDGVDIHINVDDGTSFDV